MKVLLDLTGCQTQSRHRGIGRYTRNLVRALLRQPRVDREWHVLLSSSLTESADDLLSEFLPLLGRSRVHYVTLPTGTSHRRPDNAARRALASALLAHAIDLINPDLVWHSSVFEGWTDDAVLPAPVHGPRSVSTLYDLLPLHAPDDYLPRHDNRDWYKERLAFLRRSDRLLAISEWSAKDAIDRLKLEDGRVVSIGSAVDPVFGPPHSASDAVKLRLFGIDRPFVLYAGGFDSRKNVGTLLAAFAALDASLRQSRLLVIAGTLTDEQRVALDGAARRANLDPSVVRYTGFVNDETLRALYGSCSLFVFPSRMEGFGLPVLEAMACGAPVLCGNATSLPEVVGRDDMLFNPDRVESIAQAMTTVLSDEAFSADLRAHGLRRAGRFTWDAVAKRAVEALEPLGRARRPHSEHCRHAGRRPRLLFIAPQQVTVPGDLQRHYEVVRPRVDIDAISAADEAQDARILYVGRAHELLQLRPIMEFHPGYVLVLSAAADVDVAADPAARYAFAGYPGLKDGSFDACVAALLEGSLGVLVTEPTLLDILSRGRGAPRPYAWLPRLDGDLIAERLESWHATSPLSREAQLIRTLATVPGADRDDLAQAALAIRLLRPPRRKRHWWVDVTGLARRDLGTGVHRVTREILTRWLLEPSQDCSVEPIRFENGQFRYARDVALRLIGIDRVVPDGDIVLPERGDIFVGLDWGAEWLPRARAGIAEWRRRGVSTAIVIYDLLPLTEPDAFHPHSRTLASAWLETVAWIADVLPCISNSTAKAMSSWWHTARPATQFHSTPAFPVFPLGVSPVPADSRLRSSIDKVIEQRPTVLMVGTLEPRKGHADALQAIEAAWACGVDVNLVIVGGRGWMTDRLQDRLHRHVERGERLHWLDDVGDGELAALYAKSTVLLAASRAEGHALPLLEAATHGLRVLARDIPVFREIGAGFVQFLPPAVEDWPRAIENALHVNAQPRRQPLPTWTDAASVLASSIERSVDSQIAGPPLSARS